MVQLNAFSPALRDAVVETLIAVGGSCDGLRCDMAMLMTNEVFARTWGERAGPAPEADYWPTLIGSVKEAHPDLLFMAEAYWDMEWTLQQQGFDLCYDKRLYDRLAHDPAESVRGHLQADAGYQERLIRFIENHDEPRAAATFGAAQARAAAVVMSTLQGARLYHDGQLEGRRTRIPVFLGRGPDEPADADLRAFYERLLRAVADSDLREGDWRLCECSGWPDNDSHRQLVAWCWSTASARHLVVVNLAAAPAQARVHLPWEDLRRADLGAGRPAERTALRARRRRAGRRRPVRRPRPLGIALPVIHGRNKSTALALGHASVSAGRGRIRAPLLRRRHTRQRSEHICSHPRARRARHRTGLLLEAG